MHNDSADFIIPARTVRDCGEREKKGRRDGRPRGRRRARDPLRIRFMEYLKRGIINPSRAGRIMIDPIGRDLHARAV